MNLNEIQLTMKQFNEERKWNEFSPALVFTHLIEEIGEIGRNILFETGYKKKELGHSHTPQNIQREFAQVLNLFIQLANHYNVNLEQAWKNEYNIMQQRFPKKQWQEYMNTKNNQEK